MPVNTSALLIRRALGDSLRHLRQEAGLKQIDVGRRLATPGRARTEDRVSYIECGKGWPTDRELKIMLDLYNASTAERVKIETMLHDGRTTGTNWWDAERDLLDASALHFFACEDAAERSQAYTGGFVPGPLQTPDYATALISFNKQEQGREVRERLIEIRLKRKQILTRRRPLVLDAVLSEAALRAQVGGREVMKQQLVDLADHMRRPNIAISVIPFSAGTASAVMGPFQIFDFPGNDTPSVANLEMARDESIREDVREVRRLRGIFEDLKRAALGPEQSLAFVEAIQEEM